MRLPMTATLLALVLTGCGEQSAEQAAAPAATTVAPETATATTADPEEHKMPKTRQTLPVANQGTNAELTQRYAEIKTMIGEAKASELQQCRKVSFGYKACGGPASYLIYSVQGLDEALLLQKVSEYNGLAEAEAHRLGLISDCSMVLEPSVMLVGGVCKAGPSGDLF
ncbi:hypothetical protein EOE67_19450 [Rheinheimera riviphila]|uniref:Uncharacterized protein n=1 Tax=Rheinheimera riviphila TaxID=1834037 RepID=A0A437QBR4_9GAMM|nr:hypothetical protein [Rheinheimera riviphila]RVU31947.1 hypothetical protein EOE67_19450 [Rheinheimera riviphila]